MFMAFLKFLFSWFQRLLVIAGLAALGIWLFYIGREHKIFLDNKNFEDFKAFEQVNVRINNGEEIELMQRERSFAKVVGPKFEVEAKIFDENGEISDTVTRTVKICFSKDIMINIPVFAVSDDGFILPAPK